MNAFLHDDSEMKNFELGGRSPWRTLRKIRLLCLVLKEQTFILHYPDDDTWTLVVRYQKIRFRGPERWQLGGYEQDYHGQEAFHYAEDHLQKEERKRIPFSVSNSKMTLFELCLFQLLTS